MHKGKKMHKQTMSLFGSAGAASVFQEVNSVPFFLAPAASSVELHLKLHIQKNLFVPFEVLVEADQGKLIHHYLKNPFLTPFNYSKFFFIHV